MIKVRKSPPCPISVYHQASFSNNEDSMPTPALSFSLYSPPLTPEDYDSPIDRNTSTLEKNDQDVPMTFLMYKLFCILEEPQWQQLMYWTDDRSCIEVSDTDIFSRTALSEYFNTNNIQSFIQQLYINGFHVDVINDHGKQRQILSKRLRIIHPDFTAYKPNVCTDDTHPEDGWDWTTDDNLYLTIESMKAIQNNIVKQLQLLKENMANFRAEMADFHLVQHRNQQVLAFMQAGLAEIWNAPAFVANM